MKNKIAIILFYAFLYVLLGSYALTRIPHPFLESGYIAFNMTVIVFAGVIYGRWTGFWVGICGSILTLILNFWLGGEESYLFAVGNMLPHAIMGFVAGVLAKQGGIFLGSLAIVVGHALNMLAFTWLGLFTWGQYDALFCKALGIETLIDVIVINVFCYLFLVSFPSIKQRW